MIYTDKTKNYLAKINYTIAKIKMKIFVFILILIIILFKFLHINRGITLYLQEFICSNLSEKNCSKLIFCQPLYGPSICVSYICTQDLIYKRCTSLGMTFEEIFKLKNYCKKQGGEN